MPRGSAAASSWRLDVATLRAARSWAEVADVLMLHRRAGATIAVGAAVFALLTGDTTPRAISAPTVAVEVAARFLPSGTVLAPSDLRSEPLLARTLPVGVLTSAAPALGATLAGPISSGQEVTRTQLLEPASLPGGDVEVTLRLPDPATAQLARPGEFVTLVAGGEGPAATVLASQLPVLAAPGGGVVVVAASTAAALRLTGMSSDRLAILIDPPQAVG